MCGSKLQISFKIEIVLANFNQSGTIYVSSVKGIRLPQIYSNIQLKIQGSKQTNSVLSIICIVIILLLQARLQSSAYATESRQEISESGPEKACSASQALIEMAVKTGLTLLFALLRQSWQHSTIPGTVTSAITCFGDEFP